MAASKDDAGAAVEDESNAQSEGGAEPRPPLTLEVKIVSKGACQRHITVSIAEADVERYFDEKFSELVPEAHVPGFRPGRAPRKLIETRFKKEVAEQVKAALLMDSMSQVNEEHKLAAISEPDLDLDAIEVPDSGPMKFEFDLEVRPEFDMPNWKGLSVERPVYEYTKKDVDNRLQQILANYGNLAPFDGPAGVDDYITCNLTFKNDGAELSQGTEQIVRLRPTLSFRDGNIEKFAESLKGVKAGETRTLRAKLSASTPNEALRGKEVDAVVEVLDVKKLELPELTPEFLNEIGDYETEGDLRDAIMEDLKKRLKYQQNQRARVQITQELTKDANWELPPEMLKRQMQREFERSVLELRRNGFSEGEIKAHLNQLRQNSMEATAKALKEHFILERIAEDEKIDADEPDYDDEIKLIAEQSNEPARKIRARLEKRGLMDVLRNQIIERKVIELVLSHAKYKDVPFKPDNAAEAEAIDQSAGGEENESDIPEVKKADATPDAFNKMSADQFKTERNE